MRSAACLARSRTDEPVGLGSAKRRQRPIRAPKAFAVAQQEVGDDRRVAALVGDVVLVEQHHPQHALEAAEVAEAEAAMAHRAVDLVEGHLEWTRAVGHVGDPARPQPGTFGRCAMARSRSAHSSGPCALRFTSERSGW